MAAIRFPLFLKLWNVFVRLESQWALVEGYICSYGILVDSGKLQGKCVV